MDSFCSISCSCACVCLFVCLFVFVFCFLLFFFCFVVSFTENHYDLSEINIIKPFKGRFFSLKKDLSETAQTKNLSCKYWKICIYLYIIINALNETEHAELRNRLLLKHFSCFRLLLRKRRLSHINFVNVTNCNLEKTSSVCFTCV
jgi:flagellar biosynthesis protein FlhB